MKDYAIDILEDKKKYRKIKVNDIVFTLIQVFYLDDKLDIVNNFTGITIARIETKDIKTLSIIEECK